MTSYKGDIITRALIVVKELHLQSRPNELKVDKFKCWISSSIRHVPDKSFFLVKKTMDKLKCLLWPHRLSVWDKFNFFLPPPPLFLLKDDRFLAHDTVYFIIGLVPKLVHGLFA